MVMMPTDKFCLDNFWNIRKTLVIQNPINIFQALLVKLLIRLQLLGLLVFGLQFV